MALARGYVMAHHRLALVYLVMTFNAQIGAIGIGIQWHFKCHMLELTFTSTVSSQTLLGIGMHSLHLHV